MLLLLATLPRDLTALTVVETGQPAAILCPEIKSSRFPLTVRWYRDYRRKEVCR